MATTPTTTVKHVIRLKRVEAPAPMVSTKIDLRQYGTQKISETPQSHGKQLVIDVLSQLIDHTQQVKNSSTGEEKQKQGFRISQFKKAISSLKSFDGEITTGRQAKELPGIGKGIADRIDIILRTGTLPELTEVPEMDATTRLINELTTVTGIGEANANKFIEQGVTSLDDLRLKASSGIVKLTHHMQMGLKYYHDFQQKIPFGEIVELGTKMKECVHQIFPEILVEICGSHRRLRPMSGDIDVLMATPTIMTENDLIKTQVHYLKEIVKSLKNVGFLVDDLTSQGDTKYMGVCMHPNVKVGRHVDIRLVTYDSFYPAIVYFTGSMMLNKVMRTIALQKGYTLNEYGLYRFVNGQKDVKVVVNSEKAIFDLLDLVYLEPKDREIN
uniref:DNA-directed DNA polymerase n=1 Tax=viral metagenome TaxID=1070528 RepID=A0A6C0BK46_9ZZZZ